MGTNYFWRPSETCQACGQAMGGEPLHIGKSSMGWCFSLRVHPDEGIESLDDWKRKWLTPGTRIHDEYGDEVTPERMLSIITERAREPRDTSNAPSGYASWAEFDRMNYCTPGPNGMLRSIISDYTGCIGHGNGTYDLFNTDFS